MKAAAAFAILNFVWQGAAIGALAAAGFATARTPRVRYLVGVIALALMAFAPIATGVVSLRRAAVQSSAFNVPGSSNIEVSANRPGGEALRQGTQSFGESGTSSARWSWATDRLDDPRLASMVLLVWFVGVAVLSLRLAFGWIGARRLTRRVTAAGADLQALADQLVARLRIRATVEIVESALVQVPSVIGAFKPVVLLPVAAMSGLSMEQVEALLAHELAHVRRHDYLVNLFQSAVETLLFYHPAVWLVSRRVRQERELCCDDLALEVCGDRVAYATALAELETLRALPSPVLAATGGSLLTRIRRILGNDDVKSTSGRSRSVAGIAILTAVALVLATQATRASKLQSIESLAAAIAPPAMQIFPAQPPANGRAAWSALSAGALAQAETPPQDSSPQAVVGVAGGVPAGVPGGVQGGVKGGVKGGIPESVPILVSASDDPTLKIIEDTDITVRVKSNGKAVKQFTDAPMHVGKSGFVTLPMLGPYPLAGKTLREAATAIRGDLIFKKFFPDPDVDVRANMEIFPAQPAPPQAAPAQPKQTQPVEIAPETQQPVGPPIAVGQIIRLEVSVGQVRQAEFNKDYTVQPDGTIVVPYVGAVKADGLSTAALQAAIAASLNANNTLPGARVAASIEVRAAPPAPKGFTVTVQGAVRMPGSISLREDRHTISDALSAAGGFQPGAGSRIWVRGGPSRPKPDATVLVDNVGEIFQRDALIQGRVSNARVYDGDTIIVEVAPHFYVTGFVKTSTTEFSWAPGLTLQQAIAMAGGATNDGALTRTEIRRKDPKTGKLAAVKLEKDAMTTPIQPDDVINVPKKRM